MGEEYYVSVKHRDRPRRPWYRATNCVKRLGAKHYASSLFGDGYRHDILLVGVGMLDGSIKTIYHRRVDAKRWAEGPIPK